MNFLEIAGGQQVVLKVRFAEVSRSATINLGFNVDVTDGKSTFGFNNGTGGSGIGQLSGGGAGQAVSSAVQIFGAGKVGNSAFESFLEALRQNNLLRVLAEPNLTTSSGQEANFLAGGEFPIPVPQAGGSGATAITVEYKQFGVRLTFIPIVMGDGKIRLKVSPEVSDLDFSRSVSFNGFVIPSVTKRSLSTVVELRDGQSFAVGGLLNSRINTTRAVTPVLGDIPGLGALFRSVQYQRSETELLVLVTPHLVEPMNPGQVPELPGEHWRYPTENDLFINADLGGPAPDPRVPSAAASSRPAPARFAGPYGFTPVGGASAPATIGLRNGEPKNDNLEAKLDTVEAAPAGPMPAGPMPGGPAQARPGEPLSPNAATSESPAGRPESGTSTSGANWARGPAKRPITTRVMAIQATPKRVAAMLARAKRAAAGRPQGRRHSTKPRNDAARQLGTDG